MATKQRLTNNIKVSDNALEVLQRFFKHCFDKDGRFNLKKFYQTLQDEGLDFSTESYGLEWLGKSYARLLACDSATTLLRANDDWNSKPQNSHSQNLLIKGDNLEVLKHLVGAYYEKAKMIYIDPKKNKAAYDFVKDELKAGYPTIFEITKERLVRAAQKIKAEIIEQKIAEKQREISSLEGRLDLDDKEQKIKQLQGEIQALQSQDLGFKIFDNF